MGTKSESGTSRLIYTDTKSESKERTRVPTKTLFSFLMIAVLALSAAEIRAQDDKDPFGDAADDPKPAPTKPVPGAPGAAPKSEDPNPVVASIIDSDPTTVPQLARAVKLLLDLDRVDAAVPMMEKLAASTVNDKQYYELVKQYGTVFLFRIFNSDELAKVGGAGFSRKGLIAANRYKFDPTRLNGLVKQLSSDEQVEKIAALKELQYVGANSVGPMIAALSDESRTAEHPNIHSSLLKLGNMVVSPLSAVAEAESKRGSAYAMDVLGRLKAKPAVTVLVRLHLAAKDDADRQIAARALERIFGKVPTQEAEVEFLEDRFDHLMSQTNLVTDELDKVKIWVFDSEKNILVQKTVDTVAIKLNEAAAIAATLEKVESGRPDARKRRIGIQIFSEFRQNGTAKRLASSLAKTDVPILESLLHKNLAKKGKPEIAIGAIEILQEIGNESLLRSTGGEPSPLARAFWHGDERIRLAAVAAVNKFDPKSSFAGSSKYLEALAHFAGTTAQSSVLVGHPNIRMRQSIAGLHRSAGYQSDVVATSRELFLKALTKSDYEFIVVGLEVERPYIFELIQQLRRDRRTKNIPVAIVAGPDDLPRARKFADQDSLTVATVFPVSEHGINNLQMKIAEVTKRRGISKEARIARAKLCFDGLLQIARDRNGYPSYDLRLHETKFARGLHVDELNAQAAELLGRIGSPYAQQELVDFASRESNSAESRKACVKAFKFALENRGIMLTKRDILTQYDRYNLSEDLDRETQQILGSILDIIERKETTASK